MDISRIISGYPMAYKAKSAINHKSGNEFDNTTIEETTKSKPTDTLIGTENQEAAGENRQQTN